MQKTNSIQFQLDDLRILSRREILKEVWDEFVDFSPDAWLYHTYDMQDAVETWPGKRDLSFALVNEKNDGEILVIFPLHRLDRPFLKVIDNCWFESLGGGAFHPDLTTKQRKTISTLLIGTIVNMGKKNRAEEILITIPPLTPSIRGKDCPRVNPLIFWGLENQISQTFVIDLSQSREKIWEKMEGFCRTHIRKAEKSDYLVRLASTEKDLDDYYDLHCQTYHRTGANPHPFQYFSKIWYDFVSTGRALIFFAEKDGKVIAANNEGVFKKGMSGWSAAGLGDQTSGVNNLLHWTAIQWAIENRFDYYESGEGFPAIQQGKRKGLTDFKKSFGGEIYPLFRGKLVLRPTLGALRNFSHTIR